MVKVDLERVVECGPALRSIQGIGNLQLVVFTMCGGGLLGRMAAEQPGDFYIDDRCGRLPYRRKEIMQAVQVLEALAKKKGLDSHAMPKMPDFHAAGVF